MLVMYRNKQKKRKPSVKKIVERSRMTITKKKNEMFTDRMTHYHDSCNSNKILASLSLAPAATPSTKSCGVRFLLPH